MTRTFRSGELQRAVLEVLVDDAPASGYAIMRQLADRLQGRWRPSPGAVYPALLGLEDAGLVTTDDVEGTKLYALSPTGRRTAHDVGPVLEGVLARVPRPAERAPTAGDVLDRFAAKAPGRSVVLDEPTHERLTEALDELENRLATILQGADHG